MATDDDVLKHLLAIRTSLDQNGDDLREISGRLGKLITNYAGLSERLDRIDERTICIEKRWTSCLPSKQSARDDGARTPR